MALNLNLFFKKPFKSSIDTNQFQYHFHLLYDYYLNSFDVLKMANHLVMVVVATREKNNKNPFVRCVFFVFKSTKFYLNKTRFLPLCISLFPLSENHISTQKPPNDGI